MPLVALFAEMGVGSCAWEVRLRGAEVVPAYCSYGGDVPASATGVV